VENCDMNRQRLIQVKSAPPYDCQYTQTTDTVDSIEALGMVRERANQHFYCWDSQMCSHSITCRDYNVANNPYRLS